jgi:hypothetical protein
MEAYSEKYRLTIEPGLYHVKGFGEVDLRTLTLEKANYLFQSNFPYLVLKPPTKVVSKPPKVKKL